MKLGRNLAAGLASSAWTAVVGLAVVPLYLRFLGVEAYGLIGFFATTLALFQLLDMGLAQTLNREISRFAVEARWKEAGNLLHTLATIYWSVALAIAAIVVLFSPLIARYWINAEQMPLDSVKHAVQLMGIVIACRWPVGLYQGALNGLQLITVTSAASAAMTTVSSVGAVLLLAYVSPSIEAFFAWQACVGIVYALTMRTLTWRALPLADAPQFDVQELRRIWRYAVSVGAIALSAIVFTQLDKILLSKILVLRDFGSYMLATVISGGLYFLIMPLFNVIFPRFSSLVAMGKEEELRLLYRFGTRIFAGVLFPVAFVVAAFARDIVRVWTGDESLAQTVAPVLTLLSIGSALHGVMYFPYALQLASGLPRLALRINVILLCILVPTTVVLASHFGAIGGALAWLLLHIIYVLLGTWITHRRLLVGMGTQWLVSDVLVPLAVSAAIVLASHYLVAQTEPAAPVTLVIAVGTVIVAVASCLATSPKALILVVNAFGFRKSAAPNPSS